MANLADLFTPQGEALCGQPWQEYPRPQLERESYINLNGIWEFYANGGEREEILVPFVPESLLSGIHRHMGERPSLEYRKRFALPDCFNKGRVILHFEGVDQIAAVYLNGIRLGEHYGGNLAFSYDITDSVKQENELIVKVIDDLQNAILPYGKQCEKRGTIRYTPHSGIWNTVWLESVPKEYIKSVKIDVDLNRAYISAEGVGEGKVTVALPEGEISLPMTDGKATVTLENPIRWTPDSPYLYRFTLEAGEDRIKSYFAIRTVECRQIDGVWRLLLNGKPYFFHGLLDQGYYPDGIYTPASSECYREDILAMKRLGFNTLRKHIKVEADRFYYECDRLGMLVFQDMVNNGKYSFIRDTALPTIGMKHLPDKLLHRNKASRKAFEECMLGTVKQLYNHPCIVYWTIFNEGWGQFDGTAMYEKLIALDSSRIIDTDSGWFFGAKTQVKSHHIYFKPIRLRKNKRMPVIVSEFGGYSYRVEGHSFNLDQNFGYGRYHSIEEFENALVSLYEREVIPSVKKGLCGAIYTQLSDVEDETNGLLSYDRRVIKVKPQRMITVAERLQEELNN